MAHRTVSKPARSIRTRGSSVDPGRLRPRSLVEPGPLVDRVQQPLELEVREVADVAQRAGERRRGAVHRAQATDQRRAARSQRVEVQVRPLRRADELRRRHVPRPHQIVDLVEALVVAADLVEPPHDVPVPVGPGHADVLADGDRHLAPGAQQLVGELQARGRSADDQHRTGPQLVGPLVVERRDLIQTRRQGSGDRRELGRVEGAAGQDDRVRLPDARVRRHHVAGVAARHRGHGRPRAHGRVHVRGVALDERHQLGHRHEPVRVLAVVLQARVGA